MTEAEMLQKGPYDKVKTKDQGLYYSEWSCIRAMRDYSNNLKLKVYFDNHTPITYSVDEIIKGELAVFCMCQNQIILKYEKVL